MKRIMRRITVLAAVVVAAFVAATPSLAGMNDGGGFFAMVQQPSQPVCGSGASSAAIVNHGDTGTTVVTCRHP